MIDYLGHIERLAKASDLQDEKSAKVERRRTLFCFHARLERHIPIVCNETFWRYPGLVSLISLHILDSVTVYILVCSQNAPRCSEKRTPLCRRMQGMTTRFWGLSV